MVRVVGFTRDWNLFGRQEGTIDDTRRHGKIHHGCPCLNTESFAVVAVFFVEGCRGHITSTPKSMHLQPGHALHLGTMPILWTPRSSKRTRPGR